MKAIQSFWILPDSINSHAGGWPNKRYEFISWSLSFVLLKKNFSETELNSNLAGASMLVDVLGLEYDIVNTDLEGQTELLKNMWGLGKVHSQARQNEPFIHVDGDVFWFKPPTQNLLNADIITQNLEIESTLYRELWENCQKYASDLPVYLNTPRAKLAFAANTGIVGGNNIEAFKLFYEDATKFTAANTEVFREHPDLFRYISLYVEQALLVCFADFHQIKIHFLKSPTFRLNFQAMADFNAIDTETHSPEYIHLLGTYKHRIYYCNQMEFWLYKFWPEQLQKINDLCIGNKSLTNDVKILLDRTIEKKLPYENYTFFSLKDALNNAFFRTNSLFATKIENLSETEIETLLLKNVSNQQIIDCYEFEKARLRVIQYCQSTSVAEVIFTHFEQHLHYCLKETEQRLNNFISPNTEKVLKSKYNWYNNLNYKSTYYYYNITISIDGICFQEMLLDEFECELLDLLTERQTIQDLISAWCLSNKTTITPKHVRLVDDTIKELLAKNLIKI